MIRKITKLIFYMMILVFVNEAEMANSLDSLKIVVIDNIKIMEKSDIINKYKKKRNQDMLKYEKYARQNSEKLQNKFKKLDKQKVILSREIYERKINELTIEYNNFQNELHIIRNNLEEKDLIFLDNFTSRKNKIIDDISRKKNYFIILNKEATSYVNPCIEITNDILFYLNKKLNSFSN